MSHPFTQRLSHLILNVISRLSVLALLMGLLSSCIYNNSKALGEFPRNQSGSDQGPGKIGPNFDDIRTQILEPKCVSCHANYRNYPAVVADLNAMILSVQSGRMPKRGPPLEQELQSLLTNWARAGAPPSPKSPPSEPPTISLAPNWESLSQNVFFPKCVMCHNAGGEAKFLDLSSRQKFFEQRDREFLGSKLINFDSPEESYILSVITDPEEPMPPTSAGLGRLSEKEVETLKEWIQRGLP